MAEFYEMPAISPTMEMGTLVEWRVAEGQAFESGTVLAEVGTDKANMEAEIFDKGVLIKHLVPVDAEIPPGYPIAIWGQSADEDISGLLAEFEKRKAAGGAAAAAAVPAEAVPAAAPAPAPAPAPIQAQVPAAPVVTGTIRREWMGREIHQDFFEPPGDIRFGGASAGTPTPSGTHVKASPLARKIAAEKGVDLARLQGSGPGGRIVKADVEKAPVAAPGIAAPSREDASVKNSPMRKTIARRLLESHQDVPTFFLTTSFDMQGFIDLRNQLKAQLPDVKVSHNDILIKAVARSLSEHPEVNASWGDAAITQHGRVDVGVAVALPQGLITPVVRNADQKTLSVIAAEVRELAGRAKAQKLAPEEYTGSTFTISNLGMMGIEHFTAIINPPEAAILAVGSITETPAIENGELVVQHRMKVTMTCDHRVIDGAVGASFLLTLRRYVENPYLLLV